MLREDNCQFLRVDKGDFNRILRDVEANTVRLKEHGKDVLVLEKVSAAHAHSHYKYVRGEGVEGGPRRPHRWGSGAGGRTAPKPDAGRQSASRGTFPLFP